MDLWDQTVSWLKGQALLVTDIPALADFAHLTLDQAFGEKGIWKIVKHINEIAVSPSILSKRFSEWTRSDVNPSIVLKPHSEWTAGDVAEAYMVNEQALGASGMIKSHSPSVSEYRSGHHDLAPPIDVF